MRYPAALFALSAALVLAACSTAPVTRPGEPAANPTQAAAGDGQPTSTDLNAVVAFLLNAAATDFHTHRPPDPVGFRQVRLGHVMTPGGEEQYRLCGQVLSAPEAGEAAWLPFATIQTSDYEHWIGGHAAVFCEDASVVWDEAGNLSGSLQRRLDALR